MKKMRLELLLLAFVVVFSACGAEDDPCKDNGTGYLVAVNFTDGIDAEAMKIYIDKEYIGEVAPGGETAPISKPAGKEYEIQGKALSGANYFKTVKLEQCEEVAVRLGLKE